MKGVFTALITPFKGSNPAELDLAAFKRVLADQKAAGVAGVIPCGTTGESPTLSLAEKQALIETAIAELKGSGVKVIAGTGSNNTAETIALSRWASEKGADGVLIVTPYYSKPAPSGLEAHFRAVADAVSCEVMLYNVPGRTGVSLTAASIAALAEHKRICSIKEATGNAAFASEILDTVQLSGRSIDVLSGDDATYLPLLSIGAVGVVSVASNLIPRAIVGIQQAHDRGDLAAARALHQRFYPVLRDLFVESNPGPIKHAMSAMGFGESILRLPLTPLSGASIERLESSVMRCGLKKGVPA